MSRIEQFLILLSCFAAFMIIGFRLNVRLFNATKKFPWLPLQRSYISRALFDRQLSNTFIVELVGFLIIVFIVISLLPPLPGPR